MVNNSLNRNKAEHKEKDLGGGEKWMRIGEELLCRSNKTPLKETLYGSTELTSTEVDT